MFVFFNVRNFFFYLALAFLQYFSFSVLCLALNARICFGVVFFSHAGPELSSSFPLIFYVSITAVRLLSHGNLHPLVYCDFPLFSSQY